MSSNQPKQLTWQELLAQLREAKEATRVMMERGVRPELELEINELEIAYLKIERQVNFAGFDALAPITAIPHTDLAQLEQDITALKTAIEADKAGTGAGWKGILGNIVTRAKGFIPIIGGLI